MDSSFEPLLKRPMSQASVATTDSFFSTASKYSPSRQSFNFKLTSLYMPLKLSKPFARRKSSGNVLESIENPPEHSFRVLDRRDVNKGQGFESGRQVTRQATNSPVDYLRHRRSSLDQGSSGNSGRTYNSTSTSHYSNTRDSYASTNPSSVENASEEDLSRPHRPSYVPIPGDYTKSEVIREPQQTHQTRSPFTLKSAARTFSFGTKKPSDPPPQEPYERAYEPRPTRERAMTTSSYASTAIAPKVDLAADSKYSGSDFSSGFGDFLAQRKSTILEEPPPVARSESDTMLLAKSSHQHTLNRVNSYDTGPERLDLARSQDVLRAYSSPQSLGSQHSGDGLMASPPVPKHIQPVSSMEFGRKNSSPVESSQSQIVLDAINASQALDLQHPQPLFAQDLGDRNKGKERATLEHSGSISDLRKAANPSEIERGPLNHFQNGASGTGDESLFDSPKSASYRHVAPATLRNGIGKVMTPAEFQNYKLQRAAANDEDTRSQNSEDSDDYEDEDEAERNRQMAKQRVKQEAHLAVYRQQMMKVTGEQPSSLSARPVIDRRSMSTPNILASTLFTPDSRDKPESDDDDDVPLGVLQAHGFPSKNRPPTRMTNGSTSSTPRPASQNSSYPSPQGATRNDATAGGGGIGNLPVFARHLPADPYLGGGLVNSPNRESLNYNSNHSSSLPPGGLVGVIAGEERAKALRRAHPNQNGNSVNQPLPSMLPNQYQQQPQQYMQQQPQGMQNEQANVHMQQMMQMQMQMQMMQQMMQMQGLQVPGQMSMGMPMQMPMQTPMGMPTPMQMSLPQQQNSFLAPPNMYQQRPASVGSHASFGGLPDRRMSTYSNSVHPNSAMGIPGLMTAGTPSQSVYGMQPGYTPSIAPSERSNVGQPSRYRPVTVGNATENETTRSSTLTLKNVQSVDATAVDTGHGRASSNTTKADQKGPTIRAISKPKHGANSDDDDEAGWLDLRRKREERKNRMRASKASSTDPGALEYQGGMEGLYYDG